MAGLHAVCMPMGRDRVLACAAPREVFAGCDPGTLSLTPESLPDFAAGDPTRLNLLVGTMGPPWLRRARTTRQLILLAAAVVAGLAVTLGLVRRAAQWTTLSRRWDVARASVLEASRVSASNLEQELRKRKPSVAAASVPRNDAAADLSKLLSCWPVATPSKPLSIGVGPAGIQIAVCVEGDSTPFVTAFKPPAGWILDEPRLNTTGSITRLNLQLHRAGSARHE